MIKNSIIGILGVACVSLSVLLLQARKALPVESGATVQDSSHPPAVADNDGLQELEYALANKEMIIMRLRKKVAGLKAGTAAGNAKPKPAAVEPELAYMPLVPVNPDAVRKPLVDPMGYGLDVRHKYSTLLNDMALSEGDVGRLLYYATEFGDDLEKESVVAALKKILGADGYEKFTAYQATLPARTFLHDLNQKLAASGAPLQKEQAEALLKIDAEMLQGLDDLSLSFPSDAKPEDVQQQLYELYDQKVDQFEKISNQADQVLDENQKQVLYRYLEDWFTEIESIGDDVMAGRRTDSGL